MAGLPRRFLWPAAVAVALSLACAKEPERFQLSGSISAAPRLSRRTEMPNTVLFILASNAAGVPIAVQRVINPAFPLDYKMRNEDLVLPGPVWHGALTLKVVVNTHGTLGLTQKGDLTGFHKGTVRAGDTGVDLVIDSEL